MHPYQLLFALLFAVICSGMAMPIQATATEPFGDDTFADLGQVETIPAQVEFFEVEIVEPNIAARYFDSLVGGLQSVLFFEIPIYPYDAEKWAAIKAEQAKKELAKSEQAKSEKNDAQKKEAPDEKAEQPKAKKPLKITDTDAAGTRQFIDALAEKVKGALPGQKSLTTEDFDKAIDAFNKQKLNADKIAQEGLPIASGVILFTPTTGNPDRIIVRDTRLGYGLVVTAEGVQPLDEKTFRQDVTSGALKAAWRVKPWRLSDYWVTIPMVLLVLILGGFFFTLRYGFVNIQLFWHSIMVTMGRYDKHDDRGEISHFQALTSALSATVGLGNIAGVAVAIAIGGPGAVFWMWCSAFFGMSLKFSSCAFAQLHRNVKPDGTVLGGPMVYLPEGIKTHFPKLAPLGIIFGIMFAVFTVCASFGGGNLFQGNQTFSVMWDQTGVDGSKVYEMLGVDFALKDGIGLIFGIVMAILVGLVIIGGIRRIGEVTSRLVPAMCAFYCLVCLTILIINIQAVPAMFGSIFQSAFTMNAGFGGLVGVAIIGFRRAGFSNEAGLGSAAIAHAAARTEEPVREGVVALLEPFIDTIVVCTMTALTILITRSHIDPTTGMEYASGEGLKGIELTANAFSSLGAIWDQLGSLMPILLSIAVFVFAYSTMISWSYYGERATESLVGPAGILPYRIVYVIVVALGPVFSLQAIINFADMMLFSMAFPNILGMILLSGVMVRAKNDYIRRLRSGEMIPEK